MEVRCLNCMNIYDDQFNVCPHCGFERWTPPDEPYHLHPGVMLNDRFIVGTVISFGGFGVVYRAWDTKLDIMVAIKEFFPTNLVTRNPGESRVIILGGRLAESYNIALETFLGEAKCTAKFSGHPNIINVYNYFEENGTAYIVMEYMEGMDLKAYLKQHDGKLNVDETVRILLSVISALKVMHKSGVLHRDIAPDNIFILNDGTVKLYDLGAANFADAEIEKTREIILKPGYSPPEQYQNKSKQAAYTDIYALAATMYRAITGEVPDESTNRVIEDKLKHPREIDSAIPEYLDNVLMRAMSVTPEFRFKNVKEFEDAIQNKKTMRTESEQREFLLRRRLFIAAFVLIVIATAAGISYRDYRKKQKAAELTDCTITLWMPVDSKDESGANAEILAAGITREFEEEYEQVTIDVEFIPEGEYADKLAEAFANGTAPTVFASEYLSEENEHFAASIGDVISLLDSGSYYFLGQYKKMFPSQNKIPTGFEMDVKYTNTSLPEGGTSTGETTELAAFTAGNAESYTGSIKDYSTIQQAMPGLYEVSTLEGNTYPGEFVWIWSVNGEQSEDLVNAGKRLIYYFLGENAQDFLYIQNVNGLPLNKNMLKVYEEVNSELVFLDKAVSRVSMEEK